MTSGFSFVSESQVQVLQDYEGLLKRSVLINGSDAFYRVLHWVHSIIMKLQHRPPQSSKREIWKGESEGRLGEFRLCVKWKSCRGWKSCHDM